MPAPSPRRLVWDGTSALRGLVYAIPAALLLATVIALVVVTATVTARSRWYVTPAFTTFLVLVLLVGGDVAQAVDRLGERVGETALGVAVALVCGLAFRAPDHRARDGPPAQPPEHGCAAPTRRPLNNSGSGRARGRQALNGRLAAYQSSARGRDYEFTLAVRGQSGPAGRAGQRVCSRGRAPCGPG